MAQVVYILMVTWLTCCLAVPQDHQHKNLAAERLGEVSFPISCQASLQPQFNRAVALLHSFAYQAAEQSFQAISGQDPNCAIAHWGIAMTYFHPLWVPPVAPEAYQPAWRELELAQRAKAGTRRERKFVAAAELIFRNATSVPYEKRATQYEQAMHDLAAEFKSDVEAQIFYSLALLANAPPSDKTHGHQKAAADLLEPLSVAYPHHPGIPHYLIHAYDNAKMAERGLRAAHLYAKVAPSAPHALHMPSHIFTRLGFWEDSIASNRTARDAAHASGDTGEELHAMDYQVYAYLQLGRDLEAADVLAGLKSMTNLNMDDFKVAYASTAMPIRYQLERGHWSDAALILCPPDTPPQVTAIAVWAHGLGLARSGHASEISDSINRLRQIESKLHETGDSYWSEQAGILRREVEAWGAFEKQRDEGLRQMRVAADLEDSVEKLPVTPGPILPAREQLAEMLALCKAPERAALEYRSALAAAPGRRRAMRGLAEIQSQGFSR